MRVQYIEELREEDIFKKKEELFGFKNFDEFEKKYEDLIFYADGEKDSVIKAMEEEFHVYPFDCILFDGWYIALLSR